jgi:hypothetical protein
MDDDAKFLDLCKALSNQLGTLIRAGDELVHSTLVLYLDRDRICFHVMSASQRLHQDHLQGSHYENWT